MYQTDIGKQISWLECAAELSGKGPLLTALVILSKSISEQRRTSIQLNPNALRMYGLTRVTVYRALKALESARLIDVDRQRGVAPSVTILGIGDWLGEPGTVTQRRMHDPFAPEGGD